MPSMMGMMGRIRRHTAGPMDQWNRRPDGIMTSEKLLAKIFSWLAMLFDFHDEHDV